MATPNEKQSNVVPIVKVQKALTIIPSTLEEIKHLSTILSSSSFVPASFQNKQGDVFAAIYMGLSLGLDPMQALQNIAVINGKPTIWGDLVLAICINSSVYEYHKETFDEKNMVATCRAKRKGAEEIVETFSKQDAMKANLWTKKGPWQNYPKTMLRQRARGFALRYAFPDVLKGLVTREEVEDYEVKELKPAAPRSGKKPNNQQKQSVENPPKTTDVTPEPIKGNTALVQKYDGAPTRGDIIQEMNLAKTLEALRGFWKEYRPVWTKIFDKDSEDIKIIEKVLEKKKEALLKKEETQVNK